MTQRTPVREHAQEHTHKHTHAARTCTHLAILEVFPIQAVGHCVFFSLPPNSFLPGLASMLELATPANSYCI